MYTWHFTFSDQPRITALAASYRARLAGLPGLDLVPDRWLHLTTQGIGFADEINTADIDSIISDARLRLQGTEPITAIVGPAYVTPEAITMPVAPVSSLSLVRDKLRDAIAAVLGDVGEPVQWWPHVSVAYSTGEAPAKPYAEALGDEATATSDIMHVDLIALSRDNRMYEWETVAEVPLDQAAGQPFA